jgi:hypothetical protein
MSSYLLDITLVEFASSQHWRVAEELAVQEVSANLREAVARVDAVVAYKQVGDGVHVFQVRYCEVKGFERRRSTT